MENFTNLTLEEYLNVLATERPVPGGGSVSAYVASLAMGLTQMVARVTLNRKKKKDLTEEQEREEESKRATVTEILNSLEQVKKDAFQIVNLDPQVYQEVMSAWGNEEKQEESLQNSFRLQADLALLIVMANEWNTHLSHLVKGSIKNDLLVSANLLRGAFQGAYHTAMINAHYMKNETHRKHAEEALGKLTDRFEQGSQHAGSGN